MEIINYKVIINKGLGFIEIKKEFKDIKKACKYALKWDNVKIYKNNKRII